MNDTEPDLPAKRVLTWFTGLLPAFVVLLGEFLTGGVTFLCLA